MNRIEDGQEDDDLSFEGICEASKADFKAWVQDDFVNALPAEFKDGACYALSAMYLFKNLLNQVKEDGQPELSLQRLLDLKTAGIPFFKHIESRTFTGFTSLVDDFGKPTVNASGGQVDVYAKNIYGLYNHLFGLWRSALPYDEVIQDPFEKFATRCPMIDGAIVPVMTGGVLRLKATYRVTNPETLDQFCQVVFANPGFYLVTMQEHSICLVHRQSKLKFFDPEHGQAIFRAGTFKFEDFARFFAGYLELGLATGTRILPFLCSHFL